MVTLLHFAVSVPANQITITQEVEMVFEVDGKILKPVTIGLFGLSVPKGALNFYELCTKRNLKINGKKAGYIGTRLHRMVPNHVFQGGDFMQDDGDGSISAWGGLFGDEDLSITHTKYALTYMGLLTNPKKNGSLFVITLATQMPSLDHNYQVFGRVVKGFDELHYLNHNFAAIDGVPKKTVKIYDCYDPKVKSDDSM